MDRNEPTVRADKADGEAHTEARPGSDCQGLFPQRVGGDLCGDGPGNISTNLDLGTCLTHQGMIDQVLEKIATQRKRDATRKLA